MDELLHRYRLALALIPDADAAGDLFMASPSDADLRRRAARWREQQGLEAAEEPRYLVELTLEQREHALHLARRGAMHRRVKGWMAGLIALLLLAGSGFALYESTRPRLDVDAAFAREPLAGERGPGDLGLTVYQVKFTPERGLEIWWELAGTGASDRARRLKPELQVGDQDWREQVTTRFYSTAPNRLLAVSRFAVTTLSADAVLRIEEGRFTQSDFMVAFPLPAQP